MIRTRLTSRFNLDHPILSAPMALAAGGALAGAVTRAGGLGFIGGGYCDSEWTLQALRDGAGQRVGVGFITWALVKNRALLTQVLEHEPAAVFLSFGDPAPFAGQIAAAKVPLICQVQTLRDATRAADIGADVIVAQGAEAGGHGESRATMTLVPEIADWLAGHAPDVLLVAAGGIADGVLVGSRLWASAEALVHPNMIEAATAATGDMTIRSQVMDIARRKDWPQRYTARVLQNAFTERWHEDIAGLRARSDIESALWNAAWEAGDVAVANTFVGEAAGLIHDSPPAAGIIAAMVARAEALLRRAPVCLEG